MTQINREYKDTVFRHIFRDKDKLLELYNAVNGTAYTDPDGLEDQPETVEYKLSDLFECLTETPELELTVRVININEGYNNAIVNASRYLHDYVRYVSVVRKNMKTMPVEEAVRKAIDMCIRQGILAEYLSRHRAEVEAMSIFEYDEEQHLKDLHDDGVREGFDKGKEEGIKEGLKEGIREGKKQGVEEGKILMLLQLIKEGILDEQDAVRRAGLSREEFLKACEKNGSRVICVHV